MISAAKKQARKSKARCKHGAILARGGSVLGRGYNKNKTHATLGRGPMLSLHAEAAAIRDAARRGINLKGATLYVARHHKNNQMSKPCFHCQQMLMEYGIKKVVYTDEEGNPITEYPLSEYLDTSRLFETH